MASQVAIHRDADGRQQVLTDLAEVQRALSLRTGVTWVHLVDLAPEDATYLEEQFGLHPLAVEDALNDEYQRPKADEYDDFTFLLLHGIDYRATGESVETAELNLFVGDHWVISSAMRPLASVTHILEETRAGQESLPESAALLAYTLVDAIVDNTVPVVDRMEDVADLIEEEALANPHPALLEHLIHLKRSVMRLNRVMAPQAHLLSALAAGTHPRLAAAAMLFRDVQDHVLQVDEQVTLLRERADHAVDTYHSALAIRQNEAMRVLSLVAAIFLPLTLLAGIYGMNFEHMPELGWRYAYFVVLGVMIVVVAGGTYVLFGRRLLGWGRDRISDAVSFALEPPVVSDAIREATRLRRHLLRTTQRTARGGD